MEQELPVSSSLSCIYKNSVRLFSINKEKLIDVSSEVRVETELTDVRIRIWAHVEQFPEHLRILTELYESKIPWKCRLCNS